jgi:hypothetical protein
MHLSSGGTLLPDYQRRQFEQSGLSQKIDDRLLNGPGSSPNSFGGTVNPGLLVGEGEPNEYETAHVFLPLGPQEERQPRGRLLVIHRHVEAERKMPQD